MTDPQKTDTAAMDLLEVMGKHDLSPPGGIAWDGALHKFPGPESGDTGWYVARPDRGAAVFGDLARALEMHWIGWKPLRPDDAGGACDEAAAEAAVEEVEAIWKGALKAPHYHAYLAKRGIKDGLDTLRMSMEMELPGGGEVEGGLLLVPLRLGGRGRVVNLQLISEYGPKEFWPGAPLHGAWMRIGGEKLTNTNRTLYLCDSWVVGWTIHRATQCAVAVVPCRIMLRPVAEEIRQRSPRCRLVIAAGRESSRRYYVQGHREAKLEEDPSLAFAREAFEAADAKLRIPRFKAQRKIDSSFHDLLHREGIKVVRRQLESPSRPAPAEASRPERGGPSDRPAEPGLEEQAPWVEDAPFRCLGWIPGRTAKSKKYCFVAADGNFMRLTRSKLGNRVRLLAHLGLGWGTGEAWWRKSFPPARRDNLFSTTTAADSLMRECLRLGPLDRSVVRPAGCWRDDDDNVVVHLGKRLLPPGPGGETVAPWEYSGGPHAYVRSGWRIPQDLPDWANPMSEADARGILDHLESLPWDDGISGALFAGWLALAPVCGALKRRPQLLLTGAKDTPWVFLSSESGFLQPLLADWLSEVTSDTDFDEWPGDALPMVYYPLPMVYYPWDGWDRETHREAKKILRLARESVDARSTGGLPTMFLVAAPSPLPHSLDAMQGEGVHRVHLRSASLSSSGQHRYWKPGWSEFQRFASKERGRRLLARTLGWLRSGRLDRLLEVTTAVADDLLEDDTRRIAYGVLAAGAWMLKSDVIPDEPEVAEWFRERDVRSGDEAVTDGHRVLAALLTGELTVPHGRTRLPFTVETLIDIAIAGRPPGQHLSEASLRSVQNVDRAEAALRRAGLRIEDNALLVANRSEWIREQLEGTPFADEWRPALRSIPGSHAGPFKAVARGNSSRTTVIPLAELTIAKTLR